MTEHFMLIEAYYSSKMEGAVPEGMTLTKFVREYYINKALEEERKILEERAGE